MTGMRHLRWRLEGWFRDLRHRVRLWRHGWPAWCGCKDHSKYDGLCIIWWCYERVTEKECCVQICGYLCKRHLDEWNPLDNEAPVSRAWLEYSFD